jgi:hypothetical protein
MNPDPAANPSPDMRVPCADAVFLEAEARLLGPEGEAAWRELRERQALLERHVSETNDPDTAAFARALRTASGALAKIRECAERRRARRTENAPLA